MKTSGSSNGSARWVQSAVTSVSFPPTLDLLRAMGFKWARMVGKDWITDMDVLLDFPVDNDIPWIAPKWLTAGDILFFYHTKSAKRIISDLQRVARIKQMGPARHMEETQKLACVLDRASQLASRYSGAIFAFAVVSGRPVRLYDELKHFRGTIYAPLGRVFVLREPLRAEDFADILKIGQNTTTAVFGDAFEEIRSRLSRANELPELLKNARSDGLGFRDVNADNWPDISCREDTRFVDETQIRTYLLDFLIRELADPRQPVLVECRCFRRGLSTGIVDYFVSIGGKWVPVEAKVNIFAEEDILGQIAKYIHIDSFTPIMRRHAGRRFPVEDSPFCLIMDQAGVYLVRDNRFVDCAPDSPLFRRTDIGHSVIPEIRDYLVRSLSSSH